VKRKRVRRFLRAKETKMAKDQKKRTIERKKKSC
jgi:hypothetical protein